MTCALNPRMAYCLYLRGSYIRLLRGKVTISCPCHLTFFTCNTYRYILTSFFFIYSIMYITSSTIINEIRQSNSIFTAVLLKSDGEVWRVETNEQWCGSHHFQNHLFSDRRSTQHSRSIGDPLAPPFEQQTAKHFSSRHHLLQFVVFLSSSYWDYSFLPSGRCALQDLRGN